MTVIACGQNQVMPDTCVECGGWLQAEQHGGFPAQIGRVCSEDCAAGMTQRIEYQDRLHHLNVRDLMCSCGVCTEEGRPTPQELAEYREYQAGLR